MNILGHRSSGKTSISKILENLHFQIIRTDTLIKSITRNSIQKIISLNNWFFFRDLEFLMVSKIYKMKKFNFLVDCGGGILTLKKTRNLLKSSKNFWIKTTNKKNWDFSNSLTKQKKPILLKSFRNDEELIISRTIREKSFKYLSDFTLNGSNSNIQNVKNIICLYKKYNIEGSLIFARRFSRNSF